MTRDELIKDIESSLPAGNVDGVWKVTATGEEILKYFEGNIGEVAELCDCTRHALATGIDVSHGCKCGGTGVIARGVK